MKVSGAMAMADNLEAFGLTEADIARRPSLRDAYVADFDAAGNAIWKQVLFWKDGEWVKPKELK